MDAIGEGGGRTKDEGAMRGCDEEGTWTITSVSYGITLGRGWPRETDDLKGVDLRHLDLRGERDDDEATFADFFRGDRMVTFFVRVRGACGSSSVSPWSSKFDCVM